MHAEYPRKLDHGVTVQQVGAESLVYDELRHQAFCLNPTAAAVWSLSDGKRTPAEIAAAARAQIAMPVTVELVDFALAELRRAGLLVEPASSVSQAVPPVSRRAMMQSLGASSVLLLPVVAAILAPKAAQAYGGCFDCTGSAVSTQRRMAAKSAAVQADAANKRKLQKLNNPQLGEQ